MIILLFCYYIIIYRFSIEVSLVGDLALEDLVEHFKNEKRIHPTRYLLEIMIYYLI